LSFEIQLVISKGHCNLNAYEITIVQHTVEDDHMLKTQNEPAADTGATVELVSSNAVVFKPFVIKIRYDDEVRRGLTSSLLNMVDGKFLFCDNNCHQHVRILFLHFCSDITCEQDA